MIIIILPLIVLKTTILKEAEIPVIGWKHALLIRQRKCRYGLQGVIFLPIGLLFAENSLYSLQGVTIIAAFPVGIMLVMIVVSFFKDCRKWLYEKSDKID